MKKKMSLVPALILLACLFTVTVRAEDGLEGYELNYTGTRNSYCSWLVNESSGMAVSFPSCISSGSVPPGLYVYADGTGALYLQGIPTQSGTWKFTQCVVAYDPANPKGATWEESYTVTVTIESDGEAPKVTGQPTAGTVAENGLIAFTATADGDETIYWRLIHQTDGEIVKAADAPARFTNLTVSGADSEMLVLQNVPLTLDNWAVQCVFGNSYGEVTTNSVLVHVVRAVLQNPVITLQPSDLTLDYGVNGTLTLGAMSPDGNQLRFQWYRNTEPNRNGGEAVYGAYGPSLTVEYRLGTVYYYCLIRNVRGNEYSDPVITNLVCVTGRPAPATEVVPTAAPTAAPTTAPTAAPTAAPETPTGAFPALTEETPAPNGETPAPNGETPAPSGEAPAQTTEAPAEATAAPAPAATTAPAAAAETPAPVAATEAPAPVTPASAGLDNPLVMGLGAAVVVLSVALIAVLLKKKK